MDALSPTLAQPSWGLKMQERFVLLAVVFALFSSTLEVAGFLGLDVDFSGVPMWALKLPKDVLVLSSIAVGILFGYWRESTVSLGMAVLISITVVASAALTTMFLPVEALAAGFRWLMPLAFYLTLGPHDGKFLLRVARLLQVMLLVGLLLQVYQLVAAPGYWGATVSGLSLRNPGFYLIPSSMAGFTMAALYYTIKFEPTRKRRLATYVAAAASVVLTASGAGVVSLALFTMSLVGKRQHVAVRLVAAVGIAVAAVFLAPIITGREDVVDSAMARLEIFLENVDMGSIAISKSFGVGTNVLVVMLITVRPSLIDSVPFFIADSSITASITNCGLPFLLLTFYEIFVRPTRTNTRLDLQYFSAFLPFYLSTVIFELYPVNLLMFLALSALLRADRPAESAVTRPAPCCEPIPTV